MRDKQTIRLGNIALTHILTLFIWTPRIGQLTASKDQKVIKHYLEYDDAFPPKVQSEGAPEFEPSGIRVPTHPK